MAPHDRPEPPISATQEDKNSGSGLSGLAKFAALVAGLIVLAYVLMKALNALWPE